jgi:hypothetical protein
MTLAPHDAPRNQSPSQLAEALGPERPRSPACGPPWWSPMARSTRRASRRSEAQRQLPRLGRANQRRRAARASTRDDCFPHDAAAPYVSARFRPRNPTSAAAEHQRRASAITHRVNWSPVDPHLEVQMWAVAMAGTAHRGDLLATSAPTATRSTADQAIQSVLARGRPDEPVTLTRLSSAAAVCATSRSRREGERGGGRHLPAFGFF